MERLVISLGRYEFVTVTWFSGDKLGQSGFGGDCGGIHLQSLLLFHFINKY